VKKLAKLLIQWATKSENSAPDQLGLHADFFSSLTSCFARPSGSSALAADKGVPLNQNEAVCLMDFWQTIVVQVTANCDPGHIHIAIEQLVWMGDGGHPHENATVQGERKSIFRACHAVE